MSKSTILEHVGLKKGQTFTESKATKAIKSLYQTKFFDDIRIDEGRSGVVIVVVKERPTIASISIKGNRDIPNDQLKKSLQQTGLQKGRIFDISMLERVKQALKMQYLSRGKYQVQITTEYEYLRNNRVAIAVYVNEGAQNKIQEIRIMGNKEFGAETIRNQMAISTPGLLTIFTGKDKYTKEKLEASLESIKHFYYDHGFARFRIESSQVSLKPGTNEIYITIKIFEGERYRIRDFHFSGHTVMPRAFLDGQVAFKRGDMFSREAIIETVSNLNDELANKGYTFSSIDVKPDYDDIRKEVVLNFFITPGRPVYVRRITVKGNYRTNDDVIRRAMRQSEGELYSINKIKESQRQIRLLTYIEDANVQQRQVDGSNNQIDLTVDVSETRSAEISAAVGIGTAGHELNAGINQANLFGTGASGSVFFKNSAFGNQVSVNYFNPYYTHSGIGRGFEAYYINQKTGSRSFGRKLDTSPYTTDRFGGSVNFNVPFSDTNSLQLGGGYEFLHITSLGSKPSTQINSYKNAFGKQFHQARFMIGWTNSDYDRLPFPRKGWNQSIEGYLYLPLTKQSRYYFKTSYEIKGYYPLWKGFILSASGGIHYANGFGRTPILPFYENYFGGGISKTAMVRGYETLSLGPKDSNKDSLGGNLAIGSSVSLIMPKPLSGESFRSSIFVDAANVYNTRATGPFLGRGSRRIRFSAGVAVEWRTPFGPLIFSLAKPLNPVTVRTAGGAKDKDLSDKEDIFQFTVSHGF